MTTKAIRLNSMSLAGLANGIFGVMIDDEIRRICNDLDERGKDGLKRTLTIKLDFFLDPKRTDSGIAIDPQVDAKFPAHRPQVTNARIATNRTGEFGMLFQAQNADDADQPSLLPDDEAATN